MGAVGGKCSSQAARQFLPVASFPFIHTSGQSNGDSGEGSDRTESKSMC